MLSNFKIMLRNCRGLQNFFVFFRLDLFIQSKCHPSKEIEKESLSSMLFKVKPLRELQGLITES
jgi:hypothetical protein